MFRMSKEEFLVALNMLGFTGLSLSGNDDETAETTTFFKDVIDKRLIVTFYTAAKKDTKTIACSYRIVDSEVADIKDYASFDKGMQDISEQLKELG